MQLNSLIQLNNAPKDAKKLCSAVFSGDLPQLKRLLRCGLVVDSGDYDRRTVRNVTLTGFALC